MLLVQKAGSSKLGLSYQDIFDKFRIWKLIKSNFATSESLRYRLVQISTRPKVVLVLQSIVLSLFKDTTANLLTSGPYALVFAYFVPFYLDIPVSKRFNVFGAHFSNKSFIYLVGVQVNNTIKSFTIFLEKIHVTWYLWHNCWFLVSVEHLCFSNWESASHSQAPRRTSPSLGRQARSYQAPLPSSIEPSEEAIVVFVSIACIYDLLLSFMYLLTKHKNKIATPVNLKPRRASCHFTTCVRRRGKEGVFSGFQDSRPSVQESLLHTSYPCPLEWPKRRKTYYAVCVFYNYVLLCMVLL
ncbi:BnaC04g02230D [Brassica napus]|uniref:BnaC04g02230D protein n=2 Tax=Brassica TaxID=3705 RepID=A0A078ICY0_BRANA|nr:BnaC04g02230D [Brassica napus]